MTDSVSSNHKAPFFFRRFGEILSVLIKFGFGDFVSNLNIDKYISFTERLFPLKIKKTNVKKVSRWERIRLALEELGPTFIKFGQFISNRLDILPEPLIKELEKLTDSVNAFPGEQARRILENELPTPFSEVVTLFIDSPIASSSISQVHRATHKNGEQIVFKIQRPGIRQIVSTDIDILYQLTYLAEKRFQRVNALKFTHLVKEFRRAILKELDFSNEVSHIERFRKDFSNEKKMYVPRVYRELTTTRVLTMEFVNGIKISMNDKIKKTGLDPHELAIQFARLLLTQLFDNGFFHASPHPGNLIVRADGGICFLDFSTIGIIPPTLRYHMGIILYGLVKKDSQKIVKTLSQLSYSRITNIEQLEYDVTEFVEEYPISLLKHINIGVVLRQLAAIIVQYNIRVVPGFYLLLKTLIALDRVVLKLDPNFCVTEYLEPYVKKLIKNDPRVKHFTDDLFFALMDITSLIKDFPFELKDAFRIVKTGDLRIKFEHHGLGPMISRHDLLVNRLVFSIVLGALIIGSSIVIHSGIPPIVFGFPLIGIVGFVIAAIIGFGMLFSIIHGRKF